MHIPLTLSNLRRRALAINRILARLFPNATMVLRYSTPWECLVAVQLSAQCTDTKVNEVATRLFLEYPTFDAYLHAQPRKFERAIFQTGFYRNKTKNILAAARVIHDCFGGSLPRTMREMLTIPGVARKTANVVLGNVYGIVEGIAVDTHVIRLSRQWGLTTHTNPEKIEQDLMKLLPTSEWFSWTYRVIEYGRTISPARATTHDHEPLARFYAPR